MGRLVALDTLLSDRRVWRGQPAASLPAPKQPTGHADDAAASAAAPLRSHRLPDADGHSSSSGSLSQPLPAAPPLPLELVGAPAAPILVVGQPRGYSSAAALSARADAVRTRLQSAGEVVALQSRERGDMLFLTQRYFR